MRSIVRLFAAIAIAAAPLGASPAQEIGAKAAGAPSGGAVDRVFRQWLDVFNSGDGAAIKAFYARHADDPEPVFALEQAEDTCGLTVDRTVERTATTLTALMRQHCLPGLVRVKLELAGPSGSKLKRLDLRPMPLPGDGAVAAVSAIAERLAAKGDFAGSLIIDRGDETLLARSWGLVDPKGKAPITLDTPMFLASAGKMFTAVAILQLVRDGKIELDAPIGRYLPDYPNAEMAKVTIRQLLSHRGGTGDIGILARDEGANRAKVRTIADMIALNGGRAPAFPPGSKDEYSNYGFILLGAAIEKVTGRSYQDHVRTHVFEPAGMSASGFPDLDHLDGVAVGHTTYFGAEPEPAPNIATLPWRGSAAGGGVASARDLLRFFDALRAGKLLPPAMAELATTSGATPWYGLGFVVNPGEDPSWGHGGMSYGMDVAAHHYPGIDTTFLCTASRDMACNRLIHAWYFRTFRPRE